MNDRDTSMDIDQSMQVSFYRQWEAFPYSRTEDDCIMVTVHPNGRDQCGNYEFMIEGVGSQTGRYVGARLCLFDDSWRALSDLPALVATLVDRDTSASRGRPGLGLDDVADILSGLGYRDRTPEFAARYARDPDGHPARTDLPTLPTPYTPSVEPARIVAGFREHAAEWRGDDYEEWREHVAERITSPERQTPDE